MTTVAIWPDITDENGSRCLAVTGSLLSVGRTAGEALDALTAQLDESQTGTLVIVQSFAADGEFPAQQQQRLAGLMAKWRAARDSGSPLPAEEQRELDVLIEAELKAACRRSELLNRKHSP